jgi:hypothetical protein
LESGGTILPVAPGSTFNGQTDEFGGMEEPQFNIDDFS